MDFVLWKSAKPGEPKWESPWGQGRPGWHMECSVMSNHFLGPTFDIHGGGKDLLFPHHENERAQSVAANDAEFARYWVHNGFVTVESEKMSKSLGNFITIRDALKDYNPEVLRLFLLSKHYRSPLDFSKKDVLGLQSGLIRIFRTLQRLEELFDLKKLKEGQYKSGIISGKPKDEFLKEFIRFMDDDMNTAGAVGLIFEKIKQINKLMDISNLEPEMLERLKKDVNNIFLVAGILGILEEDPNKFFKNIASPSEGIDSGKIEQMIKERKEARDNKDWAKADKIRNELNEMGIVLEDSPQGTTWRLDV
jgi:cysteinyl-tRNA synthetase